MPETQRDVDLLTLDYLLYMGTRALLQGQVILYKEGMYEYKSVVAGAGHSARGRHT
jgi:hypothetical protein